MKCGKETKSDRFFCQECLEDMERYPVKPDTPVYLPPVIRQERKTQRFTPPPAPEEQVAQLRRTNRRLRVFLAGGADSGPGVLPVALAQGPSGAYGQGPELHRRHLQYRTLMFHMKHSHNPSG